MKKVLHISKYMYPFLGGTEQVVRDSMNALSELDFEQKVICFNEDANENGYICHRRETINDKVDGIEIIRCGSEMKIASQALSLSYPHKLREVMDDYCPDIVIFHYPNPYVAQLLLKYCKLDFKLIVYWHLDITRQKKLGKLFRKQSLKLLERADIIVATSPNYIDGSNYLSQFKSKCIIIPNCINSERLSPTCTSNVKLSELNEKYSGQILCFALGRHVEYKGYRYLIEASKYLDERFKICVGGHGPLTDELRKIASDDKKVEFLGRISDEDAIAYYQACNIFCFPSISKNEAFGIALAEGMYFSKPTVTFEIPGSGVNYVSLNGITGIEVPNCDSKAYAEALIKLADNAELCRKYGENGKQRVLDNFMDEQFKINIQKMIMSLK